MNNLNKESFVAKFGGIFEHSEWIAEKVYAQIPFDDTYDLWQKMCEIVKNSNNEQQMRLIKAHPDLAGKLAKAGKLTSDSTSEQASAGLDSLSEKEYESFSNLNKQYQEKFGFPFIICARENTKSSILSAFKNRLNNHIEQEKKNCFR